MSRIHVAGAVLLAALISACAVGTALASGIGGRSPLSRTAAAPTTALYSATLTYNRSFSSTSAPCFAGYPATETVTEHWTVKFSGVKISSATTGGTPVKAQLVGSFYEDHNCPPDPDDPDGLDTVITGSGTGTVAMLVWVQSSGHTIVMSDNSPTGNRGIPAIETVTDTGPHDPGPVSSGSVPWYPDIGAPPATLTVPSSGVTTEQVAIAGSESTSDDLTSTADGTLTVTASHTRPQTGGKPPGIKLMKARVSKGSRSAKFTFHGTGAFTSLQCSLQIKRKAARFATCTSPETYQHLAKKSYVFEVEAVGAGGRSKPATKTCCRLAGTGWNGDIGLIGDHKHMTSLLSRRQRREYMSRFRATRAVLFVGLAFVCAAGTALASGRSSTSRGTAARQTTAQVAKAAFYSATLTYNRSFTGTVAPGDCGTLGAVSGAPNAPVGPETESEHWTLTFTHVKITPGVVTKHVPATLSGSYNESMTCLPYTYNGPWDGTLLQLAASGTGPLHLNLALTSSGKLSIINNGIYSVDGIPETYTGTDTYNNTVLDSGTVITYPSVGGFIGHLSALVIPSSGTSTTQQAFYWDNFSKNHDTTATTNGTLTVKSSNTAKRPGIQLTKATISTGKRSAQFKFNGTGAFTSLQCALQIKGKAAKFTTCTSPRTYKHLAKKTYVFEVEAVGPGGTSKPATKTFAI
jgi:hypothetical protein